MDLTLFKRPTAVVPVAMSLVALFVVVAYALRFGVARQADEGTAAHLWQLLMAGQVPFILLFAAKWLPARPKAALPVLAFQAAAAGAALFPVWWFQW